MAYGGIIFIPFVFLVPFPDNQLWLWIVLSAGIHLLYQISLTKMHETSPLSYAYPIARGTGPLIVVIFSYLFLHENLQLLEALFICTLISGIFLTIKSGSINHGHQHTKLHIQYPLLTGIMIASYTLVDAHAVKQSSNIFTFIIWSGFVQSPLLLIVALKARGPKILKQSLAIWKYGLPTTLVAQGGYALALTAYSIGNVGEIAALRETSILFAGILGYYWLKEPISNRKALALTIIFISAIAVTIF